MPRKPRVKSDSGMYHVMMRGINRQTIFEDDEDCEKFLSLLAYYRSRCGYKIHAWCLMGNQVHLLMEIGKEPIDTVFKKLGTTYAYYFNTKYQRVGHLFQDRFGSEPVEDDAYYLSALRYIHMNPVKAGICRSPEQYEYSSFPEYVGSSSRKLADTTMALSMLGTEELIRYTLAPNEDVLLDVSEIVGTKMSDEMAKAIMEKLTGCRNASEFQALRREERDEAFRQMIGKGIMINQAARLTGWTRTVIRRALGG